MSPIVGGGPDMPRIEQIWAFLAVDEDGDEGICGFLNGGTWMAMVGADRERVEILRPLAEKIASSGVKITLAKFSVRTDEESFG